jgi:hypothetical protein
MLGSLDTPTAIRTFEGGLSVQNSGTKENCVPSKVVQ